MSEANEFDAVVMPEIVPRRPFDDEHPDGYLESDRDFVLNNIDAAVWLLNKAMSNS